VPQFSSVVLEFGNLLLFILYDVFLEVYLPFLVFSVFCAPILKLFGVVILVRQHFFEPVSHELLELWMATKT